MSNNRLTEKDVQKLLADPSSSSRISTAEKLALDFSDADLSGQQRVMAQDIFRIMMHDAEIRVREALSRNLKDNPDVPHDVALTLAKDVESVSLPMVEFSDVLTGEDLISLVDSQNVEKQKAVARRKHVDENVSDALISRGSVDAVTTLIENTGAQISEKSYHTVIDRFGAHEQIHGPLVGRKVLPVTVAERLVSFISESLQETLVTKHALSPDVATNIVLHSRERATISLSSDSSETDVELLVRQLSDNNRLTPSIILRALCMGDMTFFEYAMAEQAEITVENARLLIHDSGEMGLKSLYEQAEQPMEMFMIIKQAIDVYKEMEYDGEDNDRERYSRRMIERILTFFDASGIEIESDDIEYLLGKINELGNKAHL